MRWTYPRCHHSGANTRGTFVPTTSAVEGSGSILWYSKDKRKEKNREGVNGKRSWCRIAYRTLSISEQLAMLVEGGVCVHGLARMLRLVESPQQKKSKSTTEKIVRAAIGSLTAKIKWPQSSHLKCAPYRAPSALR